MKILAVDDDPDVLDLLKPALREAGFSDVEFEISSTTAWERIASGRESFDCFLLDIQMPELDGIELCNRIRKTVGYAQSPIIMITRMSDKEHVNRAFSVGATDYVTKPFDQVELTRRVQLAETFARQQNQINERGAEILSLRNSVERKNGIDLDTAFSLDDVVGGTEYLALQNYLLLSSGLLSRKTVFAVKLANAAGLFSRATVSEFKYLINCAGDMISDSLKASDFFISYVGTGAFVVTTSQSDAAAIEEFATALAAEADLFDYVLNDERHARMTFVVGIPVSTRLFVRSSVIGALDQAVDNVRKGLLVSQQEATNDLRIRTAVS